MEADGTCACLVRVERSGGRSCGSCAERFAARMRAEPGVTDARASFHSGVLRVDYREGETSPEHLATTVRRLGVPTRDDEPDAAADGASWRREASFVVVAFVGLVGGLVAEWQGWTAVSWALYAVSYGFGGWYGARAGLDSLRHRTVDIDLLMILAALGALAIGAPFEGAMLLFLFSLSNTLQHVAIGRSRRAIEALMELRPDAAVIERNGAWVEVSVGEVRVGDVFRVGPGARMPLDGVVTSGRSEVDQASITGESVPVTKSVGDEVFGGTTVGGGALDVRVTKTADESAIARMIAMVEDAQSQKAETQRLIDRFEQPYALGVIAMTAVAIALPILGWGEAFEPAFYRAMTLMVAASPCALVISTPAAVLSAIAAAAKSGVLFKGGVTVEEAAKVRAVAFDKTGTLTAGETRLTDVVALGTLGEDELVALAAAVQARSEHHLARATVREAAARGLTVGAAEGFAAVAGRGVEAAVGGALVRIGNPAHSAGRRVENLDAALAEVERLRGQARTAVVVTETTASGERAVGVMAFADVLRPSAREVVAQLHALGVEHVAMLTGDTSAVGEAMGAEAGVDAVYADLLPEAKVALVRELEARYGGVAMVGDGVNDAPALAAATLGIAMGGAGTDVALETADVVLMADDLGKIPYLLRLSRRTRRTLAVNIAISLGAIVVMVATILGAGLALPLAVVGHEGSTVLVSLNGLRLLRATSR
ncbi:ATPase P [Rubricoccus marinus]|uniref:ATPase P n=1 Tax=Rubricoccus marinus TaxID=716817 RepID=A0A259TV88_9BACT|nr:ATPase P [Rubricoccus marinus]